MAARAKVVDHKLRTPVLIGVDSGATRVLLHGDDDGGQAVERLELVKILDGPVGVEHHAVHGELRQATHGVPQAHGLALIKLDQGDGVTVLAGGGHKPLQRSDVTRMGDIEHAQADAAVLAAAQRPTGKAGVETKLVHGIHNAPSSLLDHARLPVDHARHRLSGNAGKLGDVCHGHRPTRLVD